MLNFTLTITAAPELLAAMSSFSNAITAAKVAAIPEYNSDFAVRKASNEQTAVLYNKPAPQMAAYHEQNPSIQQGIGTQQTMQTQAPAGVTPNSNQPNAMSANPVNTRGASVPTSTQTYTMEQLAVAATQIVDAGRRGELVNLLSSFGVQALTALPKEQYGAFATQLRALGAKI